MVSDTREKAFLSFFACLAWPCLLGALALLGFALLGLAVALTFVFYGGLLGDCIGMHWKPCCKANKRVFEAVLWVIATYGASLAVLTLWGFL